MTAQQSPDSIKHHLTAVKQLFARNQYQYAEHLLEKTIAEPNQNAEVQYLLGVAKARQQKQAASLEYFIRAIELNPKFPGGYNGLALALYELSEFNQAKQVCQEAIGKIPADKKLYTTYVKILGALFLHDEAIQLLEKATKNHPNEPQFWNNLATLYAGKSRKKEAIDCYQKTLSLAPNEHRLHEFIAGLESYTTDQDPHIEQMLSALNKVVSSDKESYVAFGLAIAYEKLGDFKRSAQFYRQANLAEAKRNPYDAKGNSKLAEAIKRKFTKEFIRQACTFGSSDETPIFIVGMPRSGTSLTEQILASHSAVFGAGELDLVKLCMVNGVNVKGNKLEPVVDNLQPQHIKVISQNYLQRIRELEPNTAHIVDKMPLNFRYVGLIHCLFPNAKIIHCRRQKQDTVLSNFKVHFQSYLNYSHDLNACIDYYNSYTSLMDFWHEQLPGVVLDFDYENLIENPTDQTQRLLEFCGLPWEDQCLNFHKNKRSIRTASHLQVKQPLYSTSVGKWQYFLPYLPELDF